MTKEQAVKEFKQMFIGLWINHADYWTAQLAWSSYVDDLCRNGQITQKQCQNWSTPFSYGKPLRPTKRMLETVVYG